MFNKHNVNKLFWRIFVLKYKAIDVCKWLATTVSFGADTWAALKQQSRCVFYQLQQVPHLHAQHVLVNRGLWPVTPRNAPHAFRTACQISSLSMMKWLHGHPLGQNIQTYVNYEACYNKGLMVACADQVDSPIHLGM